MKKILILSDSLALPRIKPECCLYEDTYPAILKKEYEVHQVSIGFATSKDLLNQINYHKSFNPNIVFLQVGIVDCAPRYMTRKELDFCNSLGLLGKIIKRLFKRKWLRKTRKVSFVNKKNFEVNLMKIESNFDCPVVAINILSATNAYESILPNVKNQIIEYNEIFDKVFEMKISTYDILEKKGIMSDHHHINKIGHQFIFNKIKSIIK